MGKDDRIITTRDKKWMYQYLDTEEEVNEVCKYLDDNQLTILLQETYDGVSKWGGTHVMLEGRNLSVNGYCFSKESLLYHVRNYKDFSQLKQTEDYKKYLELKETYKDVEQFFR